MSEPDPVPTPSVPDMIEALQARGWSFVAIERAASLPFGSVAKWQTGEIAPEELAFLRMVFAFPWLLTFLGNSDMFSAIQEGLEKAMRDAQVDALEILADHMTVAVLGDPQLVVRVRGLIYDLRDALASPVDKKTESLFKETPQRDSSV